MATLFGGRWRRGESLGQGAQGFIYRVSDEQNPGAGNYALKRLGKKDRSERFLQEIGALRNIRHPNIMPIIDFSNSEDLDDYYFVMPVAEKGNLQSRVALYKDNLDGTVQVALGLAEAIKAAHGSGFVHRDVKPQNILFNEADHSPWLSDFGICHSVESERLTHIGDVMGPRGFTAPELETSIEVNPSCDIYSLGKVIYYMISGGVVIGREDVGSHLQTLGGKGERYRLLQLMLLRMIASLEGRTRNISTVIDQLVRIKEWEKTATTQALRPDAIAAISNHQQADIELQKVKRENERVQKDTEQILDATASSLCAWLRVELENFKSLMSVSGSYEIHIQDPFWSHTHNFVAADYLGVSGLEVVFKNTQVPFRISNALKFFICAQVRVQVSVGNRVPQRKFTDPAMALIPYFREFNEQQSETESALGGFLKRKTVVEQSYRELARRTGRYHGPFGGEPLIARTFIGNPVNLFLEFKASEWPAVSDQVAEMFSEAVKVAVEHASSSTRACGA